MLTFFEDLKCHHFDPLSQGFLALQIHRFCTLRKRFKSPIIRKPWGLIHHILVKFSEIVFGICINPNAKIGRRVVFEHFGYIIIHSDAVVGDDVIIRQGVTIGNRYLDRPLDAPTIGSRVNIGAGAALLGKIIIGNDVDIGANAVVLCDVPDHHIAVGVPAIIKAKRLGAVADLLPGQNDRSDASSADDMNPRGL